MADNKTDDSNTSIERRALPPVGEKEKEISISQDNARRFAVDILDNYLFGPDSYYVPEGTWKDPYSPHKTVLNGIYDPDHPRKAGTLVDKLYELQSRMTDPGSWGYMRSLIDDMKDFRTRFEKELDRQNEERPFLNSPDIKPSEQGNFDFNMVIPPDPDRLSREKPQPPLPRPRLY